jgi:hypothetical protein
MQPDFKSIALPLIERGFRLTPINPATKSPCMKNWQNFQLTTVEDIVKFAEHYPHHNVGVVGKRGDPTKYPARHCFLDIDADGIVTQIERETGHKMPRTYTVCSRPDSAPYKRHFYFLQTSYSFRRFGAWAAKNLNVRDMTRLEKGRSGLLHHPTLYDMKGVGGGSQVVAVGSVRDNGEIYTCINDVPPVPIPDWLVDWVVADHKKYRVLVNKERADKHQVKAEALRLGRVERRKLRQQNSPEGFDIYEDDIYDFLRWRASSFAGLGLTGKALIIALTYEARRFCEKGRAWSESERGRAVIEKIAREERVVGDATWFYKMSQEAIDGLQITPEQPNKAEEIRNVIAQFPDRILDEDALLRIREELLLDGFVLDRRADKDALYKARKAAGFTVESVKEATGVKSFWVRTIP